MDETELRKIKYIRTQVADCVIVEFVNGSRACSCGLERGMTPSLRPEDSGPTRCAIVDTPEQMAAATGLSLETCRDIMGVVAQGGES